MDKILSEKIALLKQCENEYLSYFTQTTEFTNYTIYKDDYINDMYTHNFIYLKKGLDNENALSFVKEKIEENNEKSFLNFLFDPDYDLNWKSFVELGLDVSFLLYMAIDTEKFNLPKLNKDCTVEIAKSLEMFYDGIICDIIGDGNDFPFLYRCNMRKKDVFLKNKDNLFYFIAYINNVPVGKCEVYINDKLLRIESLMVLDCFRNMRIGSNILNAIKEFALQKNIKTIYLMAEEDDTPKEMYSKMGFDIWGKECWMLWKK